MPWPKGMKRKGHINKDGTLHAKKGDVLAVSRKAVGIDTKPTVSKKVSLEPDVSSVQKETQEEMVLHGMIGNSAITEVCPNCAYAYADGGYCPSCSWSLPVHREPYGTYSGGRL